MAKLISMLHETKINSHLLYIQLYVKYTELESFLQHVLRLLVWKIRVTVQCRKVDCVWNVMAHAQKPDFVFRRNGRVHLNRRGKSGQSTTGSRGVRISGSNSGYTIFRGSVKSTCYPLHSPVTPSLPLPCVTVCHHISTGLYNLSSSSLH